MGLAHLKTEPFIKSITKQEAVNKARVNTRHAHHTAPSNRSNALTQRFAAAALYFKVAEDRFRGAAFGFKADGINDGVHTAMACGLLNDFFRCIVIFIKIDGDGP